MRFGKYTGLRTTDRRVFINVNGKQIPFRPAACTHACMVRLLTNASEHANRINERKCTGKEASFAMHLSRTGEAYFVSEAPSESGGALSYQCSVMSPAVGSRRCTCACKKLQEGPVRPCGAGEAAGEEEALAGMMSPSGYSSGDEPVPYATAAQAASIQARTRASGRGGGAVGSC